MAEKATLARPYAKAAFAYAQEQDVALLWQQALTVLSALSANAKFCDMTRNPSLSAEQLTAFVRETVEAVAPSVAQLSGFADFLQLLSEGRRLTIMDAISTQYDQLLVAANKAKDVNITSAYPLTDTQVNRLKAWLERYFSTDVMIETAVDASLMGGVVIRHGAWVMDGSVRDKLNNLTSELARG